MKLVVLAGAKKGAAVPIKKSSFIIGRSKECALRAGSDAISRKHCELRQGDAGVSVRDLGSRNGTYVNGAKIEGTLSLSHGDTLKVGPLEFRFESEGELKKVKAPKIQSVGDAVNRVAAKTASADSLAEQDISDWLLGDLAAGGDAPGIGETLTMRTDETRVSVPDENTETREVSAEELAEAEAEAEEGKSKKKEPGKLPPGSGKPAAKDSREAAMQVLRDMARRR